ncbi:MAG: extracellular solute-binding protein [Alphaproteobacteria bacterium]|nr:extracellular solute-binding protein [Alphaproteobacteria bacterium]
MSRSAARMIAAIALCLTGAVTTFHPGGLSAEEQKRHHALSLIGKPQYAPDFKHFDWVNPDAPKGGTVRVAAFGSFDSLNPFSIKGEVAAGVQSLIYDTLMATSLDEPSTEYGLIAEWASFPDDYSSVTFQLRESARFHDGKPITVEDVIFSLQALKKAHPLYNLYYKNVTGAQKTGDRQVTFTFDMKGNRELPQILGQLAVLPKHFWDAKDAKGKPRDPAESSKEIPVGSGPYKIADVEMGRSVTFQRDENYWAKDLPVTRGFYNIDKVQYSYYRDMTPAFEGFLSGQFDFWGESSANRWATRYGTKAVKSGLIKKEKLPHGRVAPMQAFVFNTRLERFKDPRVRQAFNLAFNFEKLNKSLFYDMYVRVGSYFDNSELAAKGLPEGRELEILQKFKDRLPPEVFTTEWKNPKNEKPGDFRKNLRKAIGLLAEAGWTLKDGILQNAKGERFTVEFLIDQEIWKRIVLSYAENLKKIGIEATARLVDSAQYQRRKEKFNFDIIVGSFSQSHSPGNEQREFWGSAAADKNGSRNVIGIKNPVIDELIEILVQAQNREEVIAATKALDRALLWNHYVVPQWHLPFVRLAAWDIFGRPSKLPSQSPASVISVWWIDKDKAAKLKSQRGM